MVHKPLSSQKDGGYLSEALFLPENDRAGTLLRDMNDVDASCARHRIRTLAINAPADAVSSTDEAEEKRRSVITSYLVRFFIFDWFKRKEKDSYLQGTFSGVFVPVTTSMWGVLIFIRFSVAAGYAGWLVCVGICFLSVVVQLLTTLSLCAVLSNSNNFKGGTFGILKRNLGGELAGIMALLYYAGMTTLASIELIGSVKTIGVLVAYGSTSESLITGSLYFDQLVLGIPLVFLLAAVRAIDVKKVSIMATLSLIVVLVGFCFGFIGLFLSTNGTWKGSLSEVPGVTGLNYQTFLDNTFPNFDPPNWTEAELMDYFQETPQSITELEISSVQGVIALFFPAFLGIFQGGNKAEQLKTPNRSVFIGTICSLLTSMVISLLLVLLVSASADRDVLKANQLLFASFTWPIYILGFVSTIFVGIGAFVSLLEVAPTILHAVAEDGLYSFLQKIGLHRKSASGEPSYAVLVTFVINVGLTFVNSAYIEQLAGVTTIFFLQAYCHMHLAVLLNELQKHQSWRPAFKYYHTLTAGFGLIATLVLMFVISYVQALITISLAVLLHFIVMIVEEPRRKGLGTRSLNIGRALSKLLSDDFISHLESINEKPTDSLSLVENDQKVYWEPNILCILNSTPLAQDTSQTEKLLHMTDQLSRRGLLPHLAIVAKMVRCDDFQFAEKIKKQCQLEIFRLCLKIDLRAFPHTYVCPETCSASDSYLLLAQSLGLGALKPNLILIDWNNADIVDVVRHAQITRTVVAVYKDRAPIEWKHSLRRKESLLSPNERREKDESCSDMDFEIPVKEGDSEEYLGNELEDDQEACADTIEDLDWLKSQGKWTRRKMALLRSKTGGIDVWWIVEDGGLPVLLARLLTVNKIYRRCSLRIICVVESPHVSDLLTANATLSVEQTIQDMRIKASILVVQVNPKSQTLIRSTVVDSSFQVASDWKKDAEEGKKEFGYGLEREGASLFDEDDPHPVRIDKLHDRKHRTVMDIFSGETSENEDDQSTAAEEVKPLTDSRQRVIAQSKAVSMYASLIKQYSTGAELVVMNLPIPPSNMSSSNYFSLLSTLTNDVDRVLLVSSFLEEDLNE